MTIHQPTHIQPYGGTMNKRQMLKNIRNPKMSVAPYGNHVIYRALSRHIVNGRLHVVDPAGNPLWVKYNKDKIQWGRTQR